MGQDFTDFLAHTVAKVIDIDADKPRDMRRDGWPKYPDKKDVGVAKEKLFAIYKTVCQRHGVEPKKATGSGKEANMIEGLQVIGAKKGTSTSSLSTVEEINEVLRLGLNIPLIPDILCHEKAYALEDRRDLYQQVYRRHPSEDWQPPNTGRGSAKNRSQFHTFYP